MVMSCLVEPLVAPLVGRGAGARPAGSRGARTGLQSSRLSRTALLMSAVMAIGGVSAENLLDSKRDGRAEKVTKNPHKRPDAIPLRDVAKVFGKAKTFPREDERLQVPAPALAPRFEWDAVWASRLRHADDISRDLGRALGRGRRADRIGRSKPIPLLCFGSGEFRSGPSSPVFA